MPVMPPVSVNLPVLSTAILPGAENLYSGHLTGMELDVLKVLLANLERLMKERGLSADALSRRAGVPDAIRNLRRAIESGKGGTTLRTLAALAKVLNTTPAALLTPADGHGAAAPTTEDPAAWHDFLLSQRVMIDRMLAKPEASEPTPAAAPKRRRTKNR